MANSELNRVNPGRGSGPAAGPTGRGGAAPYRVGPNMLLGDDAPETRKKSVTNASERFVRAAWILAPAAACLPLTYLLNRIGAPWPIHALAWIFLVGAAAHLGDQTTRKQVVAWVRDFHDRLQTPEDREDSAPPSVEADFHQMFTELQHTLERRLNGERNAFISTITGLASALEARDVYTRNHSSRVANLAVRVGKEMGLSHQDLYEVHLAGILHDIGKIGIRDEILLKPAGLTKEEYETMKTHPALGARILSGIHGMEGVAEIVLRHHEMYDGRGYPDGLVAEDIPLGARIVAASDTYMSLIEDRSYRPGREVPKALAEMRRVAGAQLDPAVVDVLGRVVEGSLGAQASRESAKAA